MTKIAGKFSDIVFVGFGEVGDVLALRWLRPMRGTTTAYALKPRSVIIKGLEDVGTECLPAARHAAELEEVCVTLRALGVTDWMSRSTVKWQKKLASLDMAPGGDNLAQRAYTVLARL